MCICCNTKLKGRLNSPVDFYIILFLDLGFGTISARFCISIELLYSAFCTCSVFNAGVLRLNRPIRPDRRNAMNS